MKKNIMENIVVTKETSKKFTWKWEDAGRSAITSFFLALVAALGQFLESWLNNPANIAFNKVSLILTLKVAIGGWVAEMLRRYIKPSQTIIKVTPPIEEPK